MRQGGLVGLISQRDLMLIESLPDVDPAEVPVEDAMTSHIYVVDPKTPLAAVANEMADRKLGSAVVVELETTGGRMVEHAPRRDEGAHVLGIPQLGEARRRRSETCDQRIDALVAGPVADVEPELRNEADKLVTVHYEGSTFAAFNGTEGKRTITSITADEMKTRNTATSTGSVAESVWRRAK